MLVTQSCKEEDKADRRRGGTKTSGNGQSWSSPSQEGSGEQRQVEETCEIGAAPTTVAVKGFMMMMMNLHLLSGCQLF